jgi:hypothetical protein
MRPSCWCGVIRDFIPIRQNISNHFGNLKSLSSSIGIVSMNNHTPSSRFSSQSHQKTQVNQGFRAQVKQCLPLVKNVTDDEPSQTNGYNDQIPSLRAWAELHRAEE